MELYLKITVGLLLLLQAFHPASLQNSTDSPGRTIDKSWLRELAKKINWSPNAAVSEDEEEFDQGPDVMASGNNYTDGIGSGFMAVRTEEEKNVAGGDQNTNKSDQLTAATAPPMLTTTLQTEQPNATISPNTTATTVPRNSSWINGTEAGEGFHNSKKNMSGRHKHTNKTHHPTAATAPPTLTTTLQTEQPNATISPNTTATTVPRNSSRINGTETEDGFHNSTTTTSQIPTTHLSKQNSTGFPDNSNRTDLQTTTSAPGSNATQEPRITNVTESTNATTATPTTKRGSNTTTAAPITPERANRTGTDVASGSSSERGLAKDAHKSKRNGAWAALLGIGMAVALVGLVAYVILKKKFRTGFSHSKLVEEYPSDPVLRLDNGTPLDLNFGIGGSAYYNPALQSDSIQMDDVPGRR